MTLGELNRNYDGYRRVRVAVLGASGFIGRWVARALVAQGADTCLIVRDPAAAKIIFSEYNIHGTFVHADLTDSGQVFQIFQTIKPSITFNLAGYGIERAERDEKQAYQINAQLVKVVGAAIAKVRDSNWVGPDLVHVGSALEYGTIDGNLAENSVPCPTTVYGKSKLAGTLFVTECCKQAMMNGLTARLFTVYGPGEQEGRLLPSLIQVAGTDHAIALTEGKQKRDFTYVEDIAEGLLRLGLAKAEPGTVVNLATGHLTSVRQFVETAAKILPLSDAQLKFGALATRSEEMQHSLVTIARLRRLINWAPTTSIADGISRTLEFEQARNKGD